MKLTIKAKHYKLNTACNCPKSNQAACGINYRAA
jgi:hypothetical protein